MANLDSIWKSKNLANKGPTRWTNKGPSSQGYGFSSSRVWTWELDYKESWMPKIDAFELWCWRRLLRIPWTSGRYNQAILKEISPECSLEGLILKLKLQYFGHLMRRTDSFEKTLIQGKIEGERRRGRLRMRASPTQWTWVWVNSRSDGDRQGGLACCSPWGRKELDMTEWLNWTEW